MQLTEATLPAPTADSLPFIAALPKSDPYEYLRLQGLKLKPGKKESFMGYDLQWWTQPESSLSMFSVESGYPKSRPAANQSAIVGAALERSHQLSRLCAAGFR